MQCDTHILDAEPRECGMCEHYTAEGGSRGRCAVKEENAMEQALNDKMPPPKEVAIYMGNHEDATDCVPFEWSDGALQEAMAIAQYHATKDVRGHAR